MGWGERNGEEGVYGSLALGGWTPMNIGVFKPAEPHSPYACWVLSFIASDLIVMQLNVSYVMSYHTVCLRRLTVK